MQVSVVVQQKVWSLVWIKLWRISPNPDTTKRHCIWELLQAWGSWGQYTCPLTQDITITRLEIDSILFHYPIYSHDLEQRRQCHRDRADSEGSGKQAAVLPLQLHRGKYPERKARGGVWLGHSQLLTRKLCKGELFWNFTVSPGQHRKSQKWQLEVYSTTSLLRFRLKMHQPAKRWFSNKTFYIYI